MGTSLKVDAGHTRRAGGSVSGKYNGEMRTTDSALNAEKNVPGQDSAGEYSRRRGNTDQTTGSKSGNKSSRRTPWWAYKKRGGKQSKHNTKPSS